MFRAAAAEPRVIGLAGGLPAGELFPRRQITSSFLRVIGGRGVRGGMPALQYGWPEGSAPLRHRIVDRLGARGADVDAADVIVTSGAQQAITLAAHLLLRRGESIGVEPESYPSALEAFRLAGLIVCQSSDAKVLYRMPAVSNPRGLGMGGAERVAVLGAPTKMIIEDDAYGDLRFSGPAPPPLLATNRDRVLHVGTFSKTLSPGLRIGYLIVPARLREHALRLKAGDDLQANSLAQAVVEDYLAHNDFELFVAGLRRIYARRARRLADAVRRHLPAWRFTTPEGGFGLWLHTDARVDEARFLRRSIDEGVSFDPGSGFRCQPSSAETTELRLCFSSAPEARFEEGVRRLARAWRAVSRRPRRRTVARKKR